MKVAVAGGAGFLGSHLCDRLISRDDAVVVLDDLSTGDLKNLEHHQASSSLEFILVDVSIQIPLERGVDVVVNMASPASPLAYLSRPLETLAVGSEGTRHLLECAMRVGARFVHASTSEVYGDPLVHPQLEDYWGNVNPIGPRSVYDESKRFAESLVMAHHRTLGTNVGIARIFNTYGPRLSVGDGRVVSNFIIQALHGEPLTVYGDGSQTRSLCYVDDTVAGLLAIMDCDVTGPVNIGNPDEISILDLARRVIDLTGSSSTVEFAQLPVDDPVRRQPDIELAYRILGWKPTVGLDVGLLRTIQYFEGIVV